MYLFNSLQKIVLFVLLLFFFSSLNACVGSDRKDRLKFPAIVAIDQAKKRVFVIDNQKNGLNIIQADKNNEVMVKDNKDGEEVGLLTEEDTLLLPQFPSNAALASLGNDLSRLFILGNDETSLQKIIVIDYDTALGLRRSELSPMIVSGDSADVLVGIQVDATRGIVWVSNSSSGFLHAYDVQTGIEIPESPIELTGRPTRLSIDTQLDWLAVANSESTEITFIDLADLNQAPKVFDIGHRSRDLALQSNNQGTLLFVSALQENRSEVYRLDLEDLSQSVLISEVTPMTPSEPFDEDTVILSGDINLVTAGQLTDGRIGGYYTQSSGDLLAVRVSQDLSNAEIQRVEVGAVSGEGIETLLNESGQVSAIYFASPGVGTLTIVDPFESEFSDQVP